MQDADSYFRLLSGLSSGIITLLGSVGIFISLIIQRRVERLQDILEEFMDLSYQEDSNVTGKMYKLIEKYQMHYLMPDAPSRIILSYINASLAAILFSWLMMIILTVGKTPHLEELPLILLGLGAMGILFFFRHLLMNSISPANKPLLSPIIPAPTKLRSVSYLSRYVNVSVKSILKQARLSLVLRVKSENNVHKAEVILKEEVSFDDFFYYLFIEADSTTHFVAFGELRYLFPPDPITKKPVPVEKNVNIPLGWCDLTSIMTKDLSAQLFIFPRAEKHPIHYIYRFKGDTCVFRPVGEPEVKVNHLIIYHIKDRHVRITEDHQQIPGLTELSPKFVLNRKRFFIDGTNANPDSEIKEARKDVFIS